MKKSLFIIAISAFFATSIYAGGPWPQAKGHGYFKLSEWWTVFDQHYTDQGLIDPNVTTGVFNTSIYAEYGFTDRLTGVVNAPFFSRNFMNNLLSQTTNELIVAGEAINTFGDVDLSLKYGLSQPGSKIPVALTVGVGLPTGTASGGSQGNLQTGDGEFNQFIQLDAGGGFNLGNLPGYASGYVGFNNRTKDFSEEFRYGLELGLATPNRKLWLVSKLTAVESFKNGATAETITSTSLFANNTEFVSIGIEASFYIKENFGVTAGVASAFRGEVIAAAPSYTVGIFYQLN